MGRNWGGTNTLAALLLCVATVGATQLMGISQSDGSLKFTLPTGFNASTWHHSCDGQWDVDNKTVAIITKDGIKSLPEVKEVTHTSVTITNCSGSVRYFIDCLETKYRRNIIYKCGTSAPASQTPVSTKGLLHVSDTTVPLQFREMTPVRNHYALTIVASLLGTVYLSVIVTILVSHHRRTRNQRRQVAENGGL